jgi:Heterokaryon incompatibility protein (HET)
MADKDCHNTPRKSDETLRCELWAAEFIEKLGVAVAGTSAIVTYNALSYSWGPDRPTKVIICNDMTVVVNDSLGSALVSLREQREEVRIWCDVLCMYSYRTAIKHLGNLRFMPQFSEGCDFCLGAEKLCSVIFKIR